jgi:hypothetical protein
MSDTRQTKWSILAKRHVELLAELEDVQRKLDESDRYIAGLSRTKCGLTCGGCGILLETEEDFAKHFTIPDSRYLNLGDCPTGKKHNQPNVDHGTQHVDLLDDPWGTKSNPSPLT